VLEAVILALSSSCSPGSRCRIPRPLGGLIALVNGEIKPLDLKADSPLPNLRRARHCCCTITRSRIACSRGAAVTESVAATGMLSAFDIFILSDTTIPTPFIA